MSLCTTRKRPALRHTELNEVEIATATVEESPRPAKRQRTASLEADLLTPPNGFEEDKQLHFIQPPEQDAPPEVDGHEDDAEDLDTLAHATNVLAIEAAALAAVSTLYRTNSVARSGLLAAVRAILQCHRDRGKLIVTGVGKSGYIAQKLVATCKSLGIPASFMHACEAVHGDLGDVREKDIVLFITYSASTPELLNLLPHIPPSTTIMALTSHTQSSTCPLFLNRPPSQCILLPAPIAEKESASFGVSAPTTSTTVALAVCDMLALTAAEKLHGSEKGRVFGRNHPGGAIGVAVRMEEKVVVANEAPGLMSPSFSGSDDG